MKIVANYFEKKIMVDEITSWRMWVWVSGWERVFF